MLFSICRLYFLIINWNIFYPEGFSELLKSFLAGLLFDASALSYLFIPYILLYIIPSPLRGKRVYQLIGDSWFLMASIVILLSNLSDSHYFKFSEKRTGKEFLSLSHEFTAMIGTYLSDFWFLIPLAILLLWALMKLYYRMGRRYDLSQKPSYAKESLLAVLLIAFFAITARGGFYLKPIRPFDAARFVTPQLIPLTINTPFQFMSTISGNELEELDYMPEEEAERLVDPHRFIVGHGKKRNVVLIILESIGKEYVGYYQGSTGYTPYLDSLCRHGIAFSQAFSNARKSIEGIPAILAGVPNLLNEPYINSIYQDNTLHSIGWYLQKEGYDCSFYHGAKNGSMGLDNFVRVSGFGDYFGLDQYPASRKEADFDGHWGIFDEPYLQYFAQELGRKKAPFCAAVFTLSSHHPYSIPNKYDTVFKAGKLAIHRSVRYTDYALRRFFETASKQAWFKNTVFVITADHASENERPYYHCSSGKYSIPLVVYDPQGKVNPAITRSKDETIAQSALLPLVLSAANYQGDAFSLSWPGRFSSQHEKGMAVHYENGIYQVVQWPFVLQHNGNKPIAYFNRENDSIQSRNLVFSKDPYMDTLELKLKAYIQEFNNRVKNNKFY